eukprot:359883-Chlamydomonas_euryale.AAC.5
MQVPTELGIMLIRGYQLIDPELCKPEVSSAQVAGGSSWADRLPNAWVACPPRPPTECRSMPTGK